LRIAVVLKGDERKAGRVARDPDVDELAEATHLVRDLLLGDARVKVPQVDALHLRRVGAMLWRRRRGAERAALSGRPM